MPALRRPRSALTEQQLKILWGFGAICAFPGCDQWLVEEASSEDAAAVIGEMAHIKGHSPDGPRYDPDMPEVERDSADNRVLLCPTHHTLVDAQESTYTVEELRDWKDKQQALVRDTLGARVRVVGFQELETVTRGLLAQPGDSIENLAPPLKPQEKMNRNSLSAAVNDMLNAGYLRFDDVKAFITRTETIQPGYADGLAEGFRQRYRELIKRGLTGDAVFFELADWSAPGSVAFDRKAAGVAVLTYLFHICEVFET
jgi:hypothetical protein